MQKPKKIEVKCSELDNSGQGIVYIGKNKVLVPNLLPKETALIEYNEQNKFLKAKVLKVIKPSPIRQSSNCGIYEKCGSCQILHLKYKNQIEFKKDYVQNCFKQENIKFKINQIIEATTLTNYRNKMQVAFKYKDNKIIYGFYEEGTHRIIPLDECLVQTDVQLKIVKQIQRLMTKMRIAPYDEDKRTGIIRFALIKQGFTTNEIMVVIVTNSEFFPGRNEFVKLLTKECSEITTIVQNINSRKTSIILGDNEKVLYGKGYIEDYLCRIKFKITSKSFFQINPKQTEKLYNKVVEMANFNGNEKIIDAYSGVGTIGIILSKYVEHVLSVESNKQAVQAAISNAKNNNIKNVRFICDDATNFIENIAKDREKIDAVVLDPPRSGSTEKFLKSILKLKPKKVIYVSCEASTLARDLKLLVSDYDIVDSAIVDLFVGTFHIETIVLLTLK